MVEVAAYRYSSSSGVALEGGKVSPFRSSSRSHLTHTLPSRTECLVDVVRKENNWLVEVVVG